jgi:hypothetical protein
MRDQVPGLEEDLGLLPAEDALVVEISRRQRIARVLVLDAPLDGLGIHDVPRVAAASWEAAADAVKLRPLGWTCLLKSVMIVSNLLRRVFA